MANKKIQIVRKDILRSGYHGNLQHVLVYDNAGENLVDVPNGVFVVLEGFIEGKGREVRKARLASEADVVAGKELYFIHNSEVMYDERLFKLEDFFLPAGKVARAYGLENDDIVTLTKDLYNVTPAVNDVLIPTVNGLLGKASADADLAGAKVVFEVIEDSGNQLHHTAKAWAVRIVRN